MYAQFLWFSLPTTYGHPDHFNMIRNLIRGNLGHNCHKNNSAATIHYQRAHKFRLSGKTVVTVPQGPLLVHTSHIYCTGGVTTGAQSHSTIPWQPPIAMFPHHRESVEKPMASFLLTLFSITAYKK